MNYDIYKRILVKLYRSNKTIRKTFIKWLICSSIIGISCGAVGTAFHYSVEYVTQFRSGHRWIIFLLPAAGLLIVFLYRAGGIKHDKGTNLVIGSIRNPEYNVPFRMAPLIFITTVITHLFGGSAAGKVLPCRLAEVWVHRSAN